jgi:integrative and conjugative element protein (TIGR02256 family)
MNPALRAKTPVGTVIVAPQVYRNLQRYRQTGQKNETGGALAGYKTSKHAWVISTLMHPSPGNKSGRTWLQRDLVAAQEFATRVHLQSEGRLTYLGEWHTHPERFPTPSGADTGMLSDILTGSKPPPPFLFGLILGTGGAICLWYQDRSGGIEIYRPSPLPGRKSAGDA